MAAHDLQLCLREGLPVALIGFFVLLVLVPFGTAAVPGDSIFEVEVTHEQMKYRLIADGFVPAVQGFVVLLGFVAGFAAFRFVLDPGRSQTLFSFGLPRGGLYRSRFAAGAVLLFLAVFLPLTVSLVLNLAALGGYQGLVSAWLYLAFGLFVTAMAAFCCATLGCLLAGVAAEAVFFGAALLALPYAVSYAAGMFLKHLLWGNPFGAAPYLGPGPVAPSVSALAAPFDPVLFFFGDLEKHRMFYRPLESAAPDPIAPSVVFLWAAAVVVLAVLGLSLMQRRRAEQAGFAWKRPAALHVCAFAPSVFACAFVFGLAAEVGVWFGCVLGAAVYAGCLWLVRRALGDGKKIPAAGAAAAKAAVVACLAAGAAFGYGAYASLPDAEDVARVSVSYVGSPNVLGAQAYGSSSDTSYYFSSLYSYGNGDEVGEVSLLHARFDAEGRRALAKGETLFDTAVPYDVRFSYLLKNGKTKTWYYDRATLAQLRALLDLDETQTARLARDWALGGDLSAVPGAPADLPVGTVFSREAYQNGAVYLADPSYREMFSIGLSPDDRAGLLSAIREDEAALSFEDRYFPADEPLGVLMFTQAGADDLATWSYHLNNAFVFVSGQHAETLAFLRSRDLWLENSMGGAAPADEIERILLQDYDPYIGMNAPAFPQSPYFMSYLSERPDAFRVVKDFGSADEVRDPAEFEKVASGLRSNYYLTEPGCLAAVLYKGADKWVYKFYPGEHAGTGHEMD
jgi:ABC-2 type transport system permease protein